MYARRSCPSRLELYWSGRIRELSIRLHERMCAFHEPSGQLGEVLAKSRDIVSLSFLLPSAFLVLPGAFGGDREFRGGSAIRQLLGFGVLPNKSDNRKAD